MRVDLLSLKLRYLLISVILTASYCLAETVMIDTTIGSGADTFAYRDTASGPMGDATRISTKHEESHAGFYLSRIGYLRFDLSNPSLDLNEPLTLQLINRRDPNEITTSFNLFVLDADFSPDSGVLDYDWGEDELTWFNAPGNYTNENETLADETVIYGSGGVYDADQDIGGGVLPEDTTFLCTFDGPSAGASIGALTSVNLPDLQPYLAPDNTVTLIISRINSATSVSGFASKEYTPDGGEMGDWAPAIQASMPTVTIDSADAKLRYDWDGDQGLGRDGLPPGQTPFHGTLELSDFTLDDGFEFATLIWEYNPIDLSVLNIAEETVRLYWYKESTGEWVLAGEASNNVKNGGQFVLGAPTDSLGDWGLDMTGNYAWANIDHASKYALVGFMIPEPASLLLLILGICALHRRLFFYGI
jgi:hypothetical protein